jgi:hypothetical protein
MISPRKCPHPQVGIFILPLTPIEGKLGKGKRLYGLDLIKEKLKQTSEATIIINLIVMTLARGYRDLVVYFSKSILCSIRACFMQFVR